MGVGESGGTSSIVHQSGHPSIDACMHIMDERTCPVLASHTTAAWSYDPLAM